MNYDPDKYGTKHREDLKHSMSKPCEKPQKFRPLNRRSGDHFNNLRVFMWCFVGILAGATAILVYDRLIQVAR